MGEIKVSDRDAILTESKIALCKMYDRLSEMSIEEVSIVVIVLAQYMYALVCTNCKERKGSYLVYSRDVENCLGDWGSYGGELVNLRNKICHRYGSQDTDLQLHHVYKNREKLKEFLKFLGVTKVDNSLTSALNNLSNLK